MRILVDIGHPSDVHLFKNIIWELEKTDDIRILSRDKDGVNYLLNAYGFDFETLGKHEKGIFKKALGLIKFDFKMLKIAKSFNPDILIGVASMYAAHTAAILRKPCIIFDDSDHAIMQQMLYLPFATAVCTPSCFNRNLGTKQIRYNGFKEIAYLHPKYFQPNPSILDELGINRDEKFIILRFVDWNASHDRGHEGINREKLRIFISELGKYGSVFITSETKLPDEFERYHTTVAPEKMHHLLYYASLYIGEGATMATEAGILGVPSIYVSSLIGTMGNFQELEKEFGLVYGFKDLDLALKKAVEILKNKNSKNEWALKKKELLKEKIDVTKFIVEFIEKFSNKI